MVVLHKDVNVVVVEGVSLKHVRQLGLGVTSLVGRKEGKDGTLESHLCQISWASVSLFTEVEEPKMWFLGLLRYHINV